MHPAEVDAALALPADHIVPTLLATRGGQWFERKSARIDARGLTVPTVAMADAETNRCRPHPIAGPRPLRGGDGERRRGREHLARRPHRPRSALGEGIQRVFAVMRGRGLVDPLHRQTSSAARLVRWEGRSAKDPRANRRLA